MKALLVSTQPDSHLAPLSDHAPLPLLPVGNQPLLALALGVLARAGVKTATAVLRDRPGSVAAQMGSGARWGMNLTIQSANPQAGMVGILRDLADWLDEPFVILPADTILDVDLAAAWQFHAAHDHLVTAVFTPALAAKTVQVQPDGRFTPVSQGSGNAAPTGCFICDPAVLAHLPAQPAADLMTVIPELVAAGLNIGGYEMSGLVNPLHTFNDYHRANRDYLHSYQPESDLFRHPIYDGQQYATGIWVGHNPIIHPSVKVTPPVAIGNGCRVGRGVELGPNVVVADNVIIDDEATVADSVILADTYVGQLVNVVGRVVSRNLLVAVDTNEATMVVDRFLLTDNSPAAVGDIVRRNVDAAVAAVLLVALLPLWAALALGVWLATGRLYTHTPVRGTRPWSTTQHAGQHTFLLPTFCTEPRNGRLQPVAAAFTRWLRRWGLHRLPELMAVFRGDMGLVGVMPLPLAEGDAAADAWLARRDASPMGLTGLWYVQCSPEATIDDIMITDAYYAATRTWREDWRLLRQTPRAWWRRATINAARSATGTLSAQPMTHHS